MRIFRNLSIIVVVILTTTIMSCNRDTKSWHPIHERNTFVELKGERIFDKIDFLFPQQLLYVGNVILVQDGNLPDGNIFMALHLDCNDSISYHVRQGVGPGEFMNTRIIDYSTYDSCLYIYDSVLSKGRIFKMSSDSFGISIDNMIKEFDLPSVTVGDNHPILSGFVTERANDGNMFTLVDTAGMAMTTFGKYPGDNTGIETSPRKFAMGHQTLITTNKKMNRCVVAGHTSDWLAFYAFNDTVPQLIKEYFTFETPVDVTETKTGNIETVSMRENAETRTCFTALIPTTEFIFAVYAGSTEQERSEQTASPVSIMKFDWDGNLIKGYIMPERSGAKAISHDGKYLFAVVAEENDDIIIKRYPLP